MIVPQPNAIASHGTSRPGATSAVAHSRTRCAARRAKSLRLCGQASAGLRPAAIQGRQASARPRDLPCSTIARPPDARATSHRGILHNAADLDTASRGCPQRLRLMERSAMSKRSEEHTSELQSRQYLVCRLLLEKKKKTIHQKTRQSTSCCPPPYRNPKSQDPD